MTATALRPQLNIATRLLCAGLQGGVNGGLSTECTVPRISAPLSDQRMKLFG